MSGSSVLQQNFMQEVLRRIIFSVRDMGSSLEQEVLHVVSSLQWELEGTGTVSCSLPMQRMIFLWLTSGFGACKPAVHDDSCDLWDPPSMGPRSPPAPFDRASVDLLPQRYVPGSLPDGYGGAGEDFEEQSPKES